MSRRFSLIIIILAVLGLADAGYLTWQHYAGGIPPCTVNGCETVLTSKYATVGPIPLAAAGMAYYLTVAILGWLSRSHARWQRWLLASVSVGIVVTIPLIYLQAFIIKAWCQYCLGSAAITTALMITVLLSRRISRKPPIS